jgi:hypothetical protein
MRRLVQIGVRLGIPRWKMEVAVWAADIGVASLVILFLVLVLR